MKGLGTNGHLEACDIARNNLVGVVIKDKARGYLERCELWGNANGGVYVTSGGDPTLAACTLRDHTAGLAAGVYVAFESDRPCKATVGADCVFARNAKGDVVRRAASGWRALRGPEKAIVLLFAAPLWYLQGLAVLTVSRVVRARLRRHQT